MSVYLREKGLHTHVNLVAKDLKLLVLKVEELVVLEVNENGNHSPECLLNNFSSKWLTSSLRLLWLSE